MDIHAEKEVNVAKITGGYIVEIIEAEYSSDRFTSHTFKNWPDVVKFLGEWVK